MGKTTLPLHFELNWTGVWVVDSQLSAEVKSAQFLGVKSNREGRPVIASHLVRYVEATFGEN